MKPLALNQLLHELQKHIENISVAELQEVIYSLAQNIPANKRQDFLDIVRHALVKNETASKHGAIKPEITPEELFNAIEEYRKRMEKGDFFDEEEHYRAYDRDEYRYYRRGYDDYLEEEPDFSTEDYVIEMENMLGYAEYFCAKGDFSTAYEAYRRLFEIMENDEEAGANDYFIYGFSFQEAIGEEVFKMHLLLYYRLFYFHHIDTNPEAIFDLFCRESSVLLSDIVEGTSPEMKNLDKFADSYISWLEGKSGHGRYAMRIVDALAVKGGVDSLKDYAYQKGQNAPPAFLAYYQEQKGKNIPPEELKQVILDGLRIIPEKYASRSILSKALAEIAIRENNDELLLKGYSSAFYSNPSMANLDAYLGFIFKKRIEGEKGRLQLYLVTKKQKEWLKQPDSWFSYEDGMNIYSMHSASASVTTLIIADFVLNGIEALLKYINEKDVLGFSGEKKYIPAIISLLFLSVAQKKDVQIINDLMNYYCFNNEKEKYGNLQELVAGKVMQENKLTSQTLEVFDTAEKIAVNRVRHILVNKLRGGYESACLLLTACAEVKEIRNQSGNRLITEMDTEFKRFTAFRRELKALTKKSRYLNPVK